MRWLEGLGHRNYSYQMLLVPEMFGPIFFMNGNPERVRNTIGMLNLETVGAGQQWCLKKSLIEDRRLERALRAATVETDVPFKEIGFFEGYGNDERVYAWPPFAIPGVALQRYPFAEYHTSLDTPDIIEVRYLKEALSICENFISIMENEYVPAYTSSFQPWLTKRQLYFDSINNPEKSNKLNNRLLFHIDGKNSLLDLALIADLSFAEVQAYLGQFEQQGLIEMIPVKWSRGTAT